MNKTVAWIVIAMVVIIVLVLLAVLPVRRADDEALPSENLDQAIELLTPSFPPVAPPSPTPEALTPEQEQLADFEASETTELNLEEDIDTDLRGLEGELQGT